MPCKQTYLLDNLIKSQLRLITRLVNQHFFFADKDFPGPKQWNHPANRTAFKGREGFDPGGENHAREPDETEPRPMQSSLRKSTHWQALYRFPYLHLHVYSCQVVPIPLTAIFICQDTSRNLNKVDRMLGEYREHTDDQAEAMATVGSIRKWEPCNHTYCNVTPAHILSLSFLDLFDESPSSTTLNDTLSLSPSHSSCTLFPLSPSPSHSLSHSLHPRPSLFLLHSLWSSLTSLSSRSKLREDLEESILQLQSQRQRRPSRAPSASGSTLHTSDLEGGNSSGQALEADLDTCTPVHLVACSACASPVQALI